MHQDRRAHDGRQSPACAGLPSGRLLMNPYSKMRDPFENKEPAFRAAGA